MVVLDPKGFIWVTASAADAGTVNPNGMNTLLAGGMSTVLASTIPIFNNGPKGLT